MAEENQDTIDTTGIEINSHHSSGDSSLRFFGEQDPKKNFNEKSMKL